MQKISFSYSDERNEFDHTFIVYKKDTFSDIESIREFNKNLLKNYDEKLVNKGHFLLILYVIMCIETIYYGNDHDDERQIARELEERVSGLILRRTSSQLLREEEDEAEEEESEEEENEEEQIINAEQIFKSEECAICLNNSLSVLFCNCGHIPICVECEEVKSSTVCPVCKTENSIKRTIEY